MMAANEGSGEGHGSRENCREEREPAERHARGLAEDGGEGNVGVVADPGPR
jgi:hypothetical protein